MTADAQQDSAAAADRLGLTADGRQLVSILRVPRTRAELAGLGVPDDLLAALEQHGLIEPQGATRQPQDVYEAFSGWKAHRGMLVDHARTSAFRRAVETVTRPGDRVVDVGTGSGVLAMFAAQAGAAEVVGLEITDMADWAEHLARMNGLDAVRIVRGDAGAARLDGPADLVMGEFIGMTFLDEWRHYAAFCAVRDRHLKPGGRVLPRGGRMILSAVDSRELYRQYGYGLWEAPAYGLDFSEVYPFEVANPCRAIVTVPHGACVAEAGIASFDFRTSQPQDFFFTAEVAFDYAAQGAFHGVLAHFELDMAPGQMLGSGPAHPETCWHHTYLPLPQMLVPDGGRVGLRARSFLDPASDTLCLGLTVAGPGETLEAGGHEHVFALE